MRPFAPFLIAGLFVASSLPVEAQVPPLTLPEPSPKASVSQVAGLTEISVTYCRPAVKNRKVWGGLVPYGEVWRAGANENTVVTFSTPAKVGGAVLPAGKYGLHMIPAEAEWTVIFSRQASAWGSYSYDQKEDAVRLSVKPQPAEFSERLAYTIDDVTDSAAEINLRWEKLRIPVRIEIDTPAAVVESLRQQLRGMPRFFWQGWNQAAGWCAKNGVNLDEALTWADESIRLNENFTNLRTKATLLEKKGDTKGAGDLRAKAMSIATEADRNTYGYSLLGLGKADEAIDVFKKNAADHPASWNAWDSLGEGYAVKGEKALATAAYKKAHELTKDPKQKSRIEKELAKLK